LTNYDVDLFGGYSEEGANDWAAGGLAGNFAGVVIVEYCRFAVEGTQVDGSSV
jgi:hypothetical protein